ncbi:ferredoxin-NADP reductase [Breoghania corrubedonensis]|uniref:Ferredoxin-NADP reductase n=1 Tax=Breoghania corrubedonensis TaxID=665038 RepID=A0A2T5V7V8_9HYPH|nr:hybrid-cluster NAD(P)-dependent oxidoreductase [Breoghania corrubedonensis]PTW59839.1 ferredoxin-NADP reductase [Breoghania corrubedonensis]
MLLQPPPRDVREFEAVLPEWNPDVDDMLVCRQVREETHDVKTFVFSARYPCQFRFRPGQFLTFDLPLEGGMIQRCYTISASAARPFRATITVKRVPRGPGSNWLHDNLKPGSEIRAVGPMGEFVPDLFSEKKWLLLSAGSGITPLMSMARTAADLGDDRDIIFLHAARSPRDIIFRQELDMMARQQEGMRLALICESLSEEKSWPGLTGRLSNVMLQLIAPDLDEREVYCCGPEPFMEAVRVMLVELGYDMERYHQESFDFAVMEEEEPFEMPVVDDGVEHATFRVELARSGQVLECGPDMTILNAARAAGLRLPSSCARGLCGSCKSHMVSGSVDMKHGGGIRQREIDQGQILLCCSRPTSDVVIDR